MTAMDGTVEITLTQGQTAIVDAADYERVSQFRWYAVKDGKTFYAYARANRYSPISMHRFILELNQHDLEVDHINGNGLDNRRANMRLATRQENARNRTRSKGYSIDGASFRKKPYLVRRNGRYVGRFATPEEAKEAYDNAE